MIEDYFAAPEPRETIVRRDCEFMAVNLEYGESELRFEISLHPTRTDSHSAIFRTKCPRRGSGYEEPKPTNCSGTMSLRQASTGRLLGRGAIGSRARHVSVQLTPTGRQLAQRPRGVTTVVTARAANTGFVRYGPTGWTIRLRTGTR